ncbi:MAG: MBL fold metallo-hydrolase [Verrucomicrobiales bacterium]|nr:MBL fold metallo-hydrolase [Verrucomicrobiales bacterium]
MRFTVLGSGSSGNCALLDCGPLRLLIDAGLSAARMLARLQLAGVDPASLTGILLTHEHGDHTRGLDVLTRKFPLPIYCNGQTREMLAGSLKGEKQWRLVECGRTFRLGDLEVETFPVPHDAVEPMGFVLRSGGASLGILSDVGHVTQVIRTRLSGVHTLFLEANYDGTLLENDAKRPWSTKQRIMSQHGHLSNHQTAQLACDLAHQALERIVLGHLSRDCNSPELAVQTVRHALAALGHHTVEIHCASQDAPTASLPVRLRPAAPASSPDGTLVQGELF